MNTIKTNKYQAEIDRLTNEIDKSREKIKNILPELRNTIDKDESKIDHNIRYKLGKELITIQSIILIKLNAIDRYFYSEENDAINDKNNRIKYNNKKIDQITEGFNFDENLKLMEYFILKGDKYEAHFLHKKIFDEAKKAKENDSTFLINSIVVQANTLARSIPQNQNSGSIKYPRYHHHLKSSKYENWDKLWEKLLEKNGTLFWD